MNRFEVGKTYATRTLGDYDRIIAHEILARTAKTVTIKVHGNIVKRGISVWEDCEQIRPYGTYSMCAFISATEWAMKLAEAV